MSKSYIIAHGEPVEKIIRCQVQHTAVLAELLARAFQNDPLYAYVFPDAATRPPLTAWDMGNLVNYGIRYGEVYASEAFTGCAVWLPPGETEFTEERMAQTGMLDAAAHIGQDAQQRLGRFVITSEEYHRRVMRCAHWYLVVLGVDPDWQAQGIGSALLAPILHKADKGMYPVYLETSNPGNIGFYERRGFAVGLAARLSDDNITVWYMVRDPIEM